MQLSEVIGDGSKVTGLKIMDRKTGEEKEYDVQGMFVQIGLTANSAPFKGKLSMTHSGEIRDRGGYGLSYGRQRSICSWRCHQCAI